MKFTLRHNLPFVEIEIAYRNRHLAISSVLVDTGSASTILSIDLVIKINVFPEPHDTLKTIRGVGGTEVVFEKRLDYIKTGNLQVVDFCAEVGSMDYGFEINGIIGMDFLLASNAIIDLKNRELKSAR